MNISYQVGLAVPQGSDFYAVKLFCNAQISGMLGLGAFAGLGAAAAKGEARGDMKSGKSKFVYGDANVGWGPSVGVSAQTDGSSVSVTLGCPCPR